MSAIQPATDVTDREIRNAVEGYTSEQALIVPADLSFDRWWERNSRCWVHHATARDLFREGWLSMARELGYLPGGA
ncbi:MULTISPECIES: hypothetical protein [unclassified Ensifer]|uniref:hypothetical protein n=1 Tax=unclassified Ensifer TaxID=2633371 RepID=UPI0008135921|nr:MULTISPECIES: hypothetical protein [unclassified Ensifer]OCP17402.1 hypothetical protein BC361_08055 [Ensifer sp. LC54]OCP28692.1 hypothetical protein BC363_02300 [Ensifer sp. LC384]